MSGEAKDFFIFGVSVKDIVPVVIGAIIGGIIGFGASLGTSWINNRTQRKKEEKEKAINIIAEVVKYVLKMNELANDLKTRMAFFSKRMHIKRLKEEYIEYLFKIRGKTSDLSVEEEFHSFQLTRLKTQDIYKKFKILIGAYSDYVDSFPETPDIAVDETSNAKETKYRELYKDFMNLCVKISKIDAPIRTPPAPDKKKGLAKNG